MYSTISMVRSKSGLTTAEVSDDTISVMIGFADAELEATTNQKWKNGVSVIETYNFQLPKRADLILPNRLKLNHYPVQSIDAFTLVNGTGTAYATFATLTAVQIKAGTVQTADYYIKPEVGILTLNTKTFDFMPSMAKITYTYGAEDLSPVISEISANIAAIRCWLNFMGCSYNRLNSYVLSEQTFDKGNFFTRGQAIIDNLTKQTEELYNQLGKKQRSQFEATSSGYF